MLKAMQITHQEYLEFQKKCRKQAECSYSFAKYECNKVQAIISQDKILEQYSENLRVQFNQETVFRETELVLLRETDAYKQEMRQLQFDFDNAIRELVAMRDKENYHREIIEQDKEFFGKILMQIAQELKLSQEDQKLSHQNHLERILSQIQDNQTKE